MKFLKTYEKFMINESIDVYHGSAVKFDEFDIDKIGSGDNGQKGGWGLYFSTHKKVSERYFLKSGFVKRYKIKEGDYFDLDETLDDNLKDQIVSELKTREIDESQIEQFQSDYDSQNTNKQVLEWLEYVLDGPKNTSMFIQDLGYIGNTFQDTWDTEATNYVLFDTSDIIKEIPMDDEEDF